MTVPAEAVEQQLWDFVHAYDAAYDRAARSVGLSAAQACLLKAVSEEPRTMGELATYLLCDASNVTQLVNRLEAAHMVTRVPQPNDRRSKKVAITDIGAAKNQQVRGAFDLPRERIARLSLTSQQMLNELLDELLRG